MTQSEFIKQYCEKSKTSEKELNDNGLFAVPCNCSEDNCKGWAMESFASLFDHLSLNIDVDMFDLYAECISHL